MAQRTFRQEPAGGNGAGDGDRHHDNGDCGRRAECDRLWVDLVPAGFDVRLLRRSRVGTRTRRVVLRSANGKRLSGSSDAGSVFLADPGSDLFAGAVAGVEARVPTREWSDSIAAGVSRPYVPCSRPSFDFG